jgi:hypothetical protein
VAAAKVDADALRSALAERDARLKAQSKALQAVEEELQARRSPPSSEAVLLSLPLPLHRRTSV